MSSSRARFFIYPMYPHGETIKLLLWWNKEKLLWSHRQSELKYTLLQLSHGGPIQRQTPGSDPPMIIFCQDRHCVWSLSHREFRALLITRWHFSLFNTMTNAIKIASLKCRLEAKFKFLWLPILTLSNKISCILHNTQGIVLKFSHMM